MVDSKTKTILVVDDEPLFLSSVVDGVKHRFPGVTILSANNGRKALELVDQQPSIDVLATDLRMPEMDGFQLLAELSTRLFRAPIIVITAFATTEAEKVIRRHGALEVLEKPVDIDEMLGRLEELATNPSTDVGMLSPAGFSRLLAREQRSGVLTVVNGELQGELVFNQGTLIDAVTGIWSGDAAALEIFDWGPAKLYFREIKPACRQRVDSYIDDLLLGVTSSKPRITLEVDVNEDLRKQLQREADSTKKKQEVEERNMATVNESIDKAMEIDGALVAALVDYESGMTLGSKGDAFSAEVAASGNTAVVGAKMQVMQQLGLKSEIEDILISLSDQYHLIRPLAKLPNLFLYLAIDRKKGNLGMARHQLSAIEKALEI